MGNRLVSANRYDVPLLNEYYSALHEHFQYVQWCTYEIITYLTVVDARARDVLPLLRRIRRKTRSQGVSA